MFSIIHWTPGEAIYVGGVLAVITLVCVPVGFTIIAIVEDVYRAFFRPTPRLPTSPKFVLRDKKDKD